MVSFSNDSRLVDRPAQTDVLTRRIYRQTVLLVVSVGTLLTAMSGSAVNLALPHIGHELQISIESSRWVVQAFLLAVGVLLLVVGRLSDSVGHRRIYLVGFTVVGGTAIGCALAPSFNWLVTFRLLQGVGGAMVMASSPALLTTSFPANQRGRVLGVQATATYVGLTVGPPLGGVIVAWLGWRGIFYLMASISGFLIALGWWALPKSTRRETHSQFDWPGTVTLTFGLPLVLIAISEGSLWGWSHWRLWICAIVGLAALYGFVLVERDSPRVSVHAPESSATNSPVKSSAPAGPARIVLALPDEPDRGRKPVLRDELAAVVTQWQYPRERLRPRPLLDLSLFHSRVFVGAVLSAIANYVALFVVLLLLPFFLQEGLDLSAIKTGVVLSVQTAIMALVASPAGWLSDRVGSRGLAVTGLSILSFGLLGLSFNIDGCTDLIVAAWLAVMGLGTGIFISPNSSALMGSAPGRQQGVAGAVLAEARILGMLIGVSIGSAVFQASGGRTGAAWRLEELVALRYTLWTAAAVAFTGAAIAGLREKKKGTG